MSENHEEEEEYHDLKTYENTSKVSALLNSRIEMFLLGGLFRQFSESPELFTKNANTQQSEEEHIVTSTVASPLPERASAHQKIPEIPCLLRRIEALMSNPEMANSS